MIPHGWLFMTTLGSIHVVGAGDTVDNCIMTININWPIIIIIIIYYYYYHYCYYYYYHGIIIRPIVIIITIQQIYCTPYLKFACFVCYLKIINTSEKQCTSLDCPRNSKMVLKFS